jgi:DNA modification methylase
VSARLFHGDCIDVLSSFESDSIDQIVCDPQYGIRFGGAKWDYELPGVDRWRAILRVAKPGSFLLAFGGTRTFHRAACEIEDAGWSLRDCMSWLYGQGWPKADTCLKPAWEPIIVAAKGQAAALNIDGARIFTDWSERSDSWKRSGHSAKPDAKKIAAPPGNGIACHPLGRWPTNVLLDEEAARELDSQAGERRSGSWNGQRRAPKTRNAYGSFAGTKAEARIESSSGGASRFFFVSKARFESQRGVDNDWPTVKPIDLMRHLVRLTKRREGGVVCDPFMGSGTTGVAALAEGLSFIGIDRDAHAFEIARRRIGEVDPLFAQEVAAP